MNANGLNRRLQKHRKTPNRTAGITAKTSRTQVGLVIARLSMAWNTYISVSLFLVPDTAGSNIAIRVMVTGNRASHTFLSFNVF
jgi:hypothetical protein